MADPIASRLPRGRTALLVIDVQKDFCADDGVMGRVFGLDLRTIQDAVPRLNTVIAAARRARVPVVWVREVFDPARMAPNQRRIHGDAETLQLIRVGTDGVDWYAGVTPPLPSEPVITKWHYDAFAEPWLERWLRSRDIETVILAGFTTNVCVETTGRHAYLLGFEVVTLADCTGAPDPAEHAAALVNLGRYFGTVTESATVLEAWSSATSAGARA